MSEEAWHAARLIPTSGINGAEEQERRATSALLAVMASVREFGRAITQPIGAPAGTVQTFIEVPFELGDKRVYPDGLIRVVRGQRQWTALVEVKTGGNELATDQLEAYLDVARDRGFDALLTISNEIPPIAGQHPTKVDNRKLEKVALHHLSWTQVLTEAVMQKEYRGVADPDQAWILSELIRYLEHPRSGAMQFSDMGAAWVTVREAVAAGTLRPADKGLPEVTARFDALLRYACLQPGRRLGRDVTPALTRKELAEPVLRAQALTAELCSSGTLSGAIKIPGHSRSAPSGRRPARRADRVPLDNLITAVTPDGVVMAELSLYDIRRTNAGLRQLIDVSVQRRSAAFRLRGWPTRDDAVADATVRDTLAILHTGHHDGESRQALQLLRALPGSRATSFTPTLSKCCPATPTTFGSRRRPDLHARDQHHRSHQPGRRGSEVVVVTRLAVRPHQPALLPDGKILIFDNGREHQRTRLVVVDPATRRVTWTWTADPPESCASPGSGNTSRSWRSARPKHKHSLTLGCPQRPSSRRASP